MRNTMRLCACARNVPLQPLSHRPARKAVDWVYPKPLTLNPDLKLADSTALCVKVPADSLEVQGCKRRDPGGTNSGVCTEIEWTACEY